MLPRKIALPLSLALTALLGFVITSFATNAGWLGEASQQPASRCRRGTHRLTADRCVGPGDACPPDSANRPDYDRGPTSSRARRRTGGHRGYGLRLPGRARLSRGPSPDGCRYRDRRDDEASPHLPDRRRRGRLHDFFPAGGRVFGNDRPQRTRPTRSGFVRPDQYLRVLLRFNQCPNRCQLVGQSKRSQAGRAVHDERAQQRARGRVGGLSHPAPARTLLARKGEASNAYQILRRQAANHVRRACSLPQSSGEVWPGTSGPQRPRLRSLNPLTNRYRP